jgi:alginate O-acetyltransferase complex protein AlgI
MIFTSFEFFVFLVAYLGANFLCPSRLRIWLLIAASTVFYAAWRPSYVWLPFLLTAVALLGTQWTVMAKGPLSRFRLSLTLVILFAPLAIFKYADFFYHEIGGLFIDTLGNIVDQPLPLGISFVTFTLTAYVVDVVVGRYRGPRSAVDVTAYTLFFPHLIAGPILRPRDLIPQLPIIRSGRLFDVSGAIAIITLGVIKKVIVADQLALMVDAAYAAPDRIDAWTVLVAIYGFSGQIYCDFSGYTDIAIGVAKLIGVRLPNNFFKPYMAGSLIEFWRRWHISLSHWLRDYLYIPLGGNRLGPRRRTINLLITMTLGGLWHGANWTFVIWGMAHGAGLVVVHGLRNAGVTISRSLGILLTFHFVTACWILFRAPDMRTAETLVMRLFTASWSDPGSLARHGFPIFIGVAFLLLHRYDSHGMMRLLARRFPPAVLIPVCACIWIVSIALSQGSSAKFIYFDF